MLKIVRTLFILALSAIPLSAHAQDTDYVVSSSGWGSAQADAVGAAGGSVVFSHSGAGVAVVRSSASDFAARLLASGAVQTVNADRMVEWNQPAAGATI